MASFFSVSKNQVTIIVTLLVLISLGTSYFFIYLPKNENTVQERRFRCLQNIDNNIHSKIENSISLINTFLDAYGKNNGDSAKKQHFNDTIDHFPKNYFTLL